MAAARSPTRCRCRAAAPTRLRHRRDREPAAATGGAKLAESGCESGRDGSAASLGAVASRGAGGSASPSARRLFPGTEREWGRNRHPLRLPPAVAAALRRHRRCFPRPAEPGLTHCLVPADRASPSVRAPETGRCGAGCRRGRGSAVAQPCLAGSRGVAGNWQCHTAGTRGQPDGPRYFGSGVRDGRAGITRPKRQKRVLLGCVIDSGS